MTIKKWMRRFDRALVYPMLQLIYPKYQRCANYKLSTSILIKYGVLQKIVGFNRPVPWPVHFTSIVLAHKNISKGTDCDPGDNLNNYIQAFNGVEFGDYVELGPGVKIISANHKIDNMLDIETCEPIRIGSHVWLGADVIVLPGIQIGNNVTIGAGSIVTKNIPDNAIAVGNPCRTIKIKAVR